MWRWWRRDRWSRFGVGWSWRWRLVGCCSGGCWPRSGTSALQLGNPGWGYLNQQQHKLQHCSNWQRQNWRCCRCHFEHSDKYYHWIWISWDCPGTRVEGWFYRQSPVILSWWLQVYFCSFEVVGCRCRSGGGRVGVSYWPVGFGLWFIGWWEDWEFIFFGWIRRRSRLCCIGLWGKGLQGGLWTSRSNLWGWIFATAVLFCSIVSHRLLYLLRWGFYSTWQNRSFLHWVLRVNFQLWTENLVQVGYLLSLLSYFLSFRLYRLWIHFLTWWNWIQK